jgi:hypothetical protein
VDGPDEADRNGGFVALGLPQLLLDSLTEALGRAADRIVVGGAHGGLRAALQAQVRLAAADVPAPTPSAGRLSGS